MYHIQTEFFKGKDINQATLQANWLCSDLMPFVCLAIESHATQHGAGFILAFLSSECEELHTY